VGVTLYDETMTFVFFIAAAFFEIAGCFAFWSYFRNGRSVWALAFGTVALMPFAYALTRVDSGSPVRGAECCVLPCLAWRSE
jgi:small multidrug resistance family-3 protein